MSTDRPTPPDGFEQFEGDDPDGDVLTIELGPGDVLEGLVLDFAEGEGEYGPWCRLEIKDESCGVVRYFAKGEVKRAARKAASRSENGCGSRDRSTHQRELIRDRWIRSVMHERAAEFADRAESRYDAAVDVVEFEAGTKTAAAAADAVGCETAAIASTIVASLSGGERDGELVAAITSGANRLDLDAVADHFGGEGAAMADPERIREVVGWSIGGVPPLCHETTIPTVFDPRLSEYDVVYGAAGTPSAVFAIDPERLAGLADATVADLTE